MPPSVKPVELGLWAYVFGGKWYDSATKKITANDPHNVDALKWMAHYAKLFDLRKIQATRPETEPAAAIGAILQGGYPATVRSRYERPDNRIADIDLPGLRGDAVVLDGPVWRVVDVGAGADAVAPLRHDDRE